MPQDHSPNQRSLSDDELAEIRRRRPGVRASLACEGMILSADEEALFEEMDAQRLSPEARRQRVLAFDRARRAKSRSGG